MFDSVATLPHHSHHPLAFVMYAVFCDVCGIWDVFGQLPDIFVTNWGSPSRICENCALAFVVKWSEDGCGGASKGNWNMNLTLKC